MLLSKETIEAEISILTININNIDLNLKTKKDFVSRDQIRAWNKTRKKLAVKRNLLKYLLKEDQTHETKEQQDTRLHNRQP